MITHAALSQKNTAGRRDVLTFDNKLERVTEPGGLPISCRIQSVDKVRGRYDKAGRGIENFLSGKIICTGAYISTQRYRPGVVAGIAILPVFLPARRSYRERK